MQMDKELTRDVLEEFAKAKNQSKLKIPAVQYRKTGSPARRMSDFNPSRSRTYIGKYLDSTLRL
jgi:hypothetical protein